jgi:hypothetical protein
MSRSDKATLLQDKFVELLERYNSSDARGKYKLAEHHFVTRKGFNALYVVLRETIILPHNNVFITQLPYLQYA